MANLLNEYQKMQGEFEKKISEGTLEMESLIVLQELNYRVYVLKTLQTFCKTAPVTDDMKVVSLHYHVMHIFSDFLIKDHTIGTKADDVQKKKRETARENLDKILKESFKVYDSFKMTSKEHYKMCVSKTINTVLAAWIQFRDTFITF